MLLTILSYFDPDDNNSDYYDKSPTGSIVRDNMSSSGSHCDATREEDGWEQISIPISVEEDYEIVLPPYDFPGSNDAITSTTANNSNSSLSERMKEWRQQRSLQRNQLGTSISKTFAKLSKEDPNQMEEDAIQRAIDLSMLDVALVHSHRHPKDRSQWEEQQELPFKILGIAENASLKEVKTAYRRLARLHHPDKGGDAHRFEEIARAYRSLLSSSVARVSSSVSSSSMKTGIEETPRLSTATCDRELKDHRRLVNDLFQADGMDLKACVTKQMGSLDLLGLTFRDAGAINRNEQNEIIHNSCFYLSLATSYLWGIGALSFQNEENVRIGGEKFEDGLISFVDVDGGNDNLGTKYSNGKDEDELLVGDTALLLKRTIEAAVVKAHPEWVLQGMVGEEVQAFSDFLVYTLDSQTLLSDWAIVVFDATSGFCDIYKGRNYEKQKSTMQSNTITLRYIPGHYQPLVPSNSNARRPTLNDITTALDAMEIFYVVTDGNS